MLSHPRRFARRDQRGQAILAALFILGYLGLLTIVFLNYASVTQGQYGRTEQTAKQNASIEGAIDAGLVAAGRDTQLSCATGRSSGTGTLKFPAGTGSGPLSANQLFPAAQTLNPLTFSYDKCYPNGAIGPPGGRGGLLQPACVVCTLSNVSPSLTVGGSGSVQFRVQGPIWANDTLSLQGGNAKIQSTKVTSWKPPPPCNANPMICVNGPSSSCPVAQCSPVPTFTPPFTGGAPQDPLFSTGLVTSPTPPSQSPAIYSCSSGSITSPCPAIPQATGGGNQYVFSSLQLSGGKLTIPGGTYFFEEGTGGGGLNISGKGELATGPVFASSSSTAFTTTSAKDTTNPATVASAWVGSPVVAGSCGATVTANDNKGGFTVGSWTGTGCTTKPSNNSVFMVGATFTSSATTTFTATGATDTSAPTTVANSLVGLQIVAGACSGTITANNNTGGFTVAGGWAPTGCNTLASPATSVPSANTAFTVGATFNSSSTTTFTSTGAQDTTNPATATNAWVGSPISAGFCTGLITANDKKGGFTVGGGWTTLGGGSGCSPAPPANTQFTVGGVSIFLTCTGYSGPSYSCPSAYKNDTNNFFSVSGQGGMTLVPPATFPEVIVWEYPGPTGVTGSGGVGGAISIAGQSSFIGTTYAPLASVMLSGGGAGNGGMIVVGTLNVAGGGCGGCLAPFGTIPGFGPATGICPTFDIEAQATSIVANQYARALIQTGQCLSNPTLGLVNFSYQFGTPP